MMTTTLDTTFAFPPALLASAPPIAGRAASAANGGAPTTGTADATPLPGGAGGGSPPPAGMDPTFLFVIMGLFIFMIVMSTMSSRKEKKRRAEMLSSITRYDRVQTIGGLIGTVVELRDDEIVLKVDDSTNTRITFTRGAVQSIMKKGRSQDGRRAESEPEHEPEPEPASSRA